MTFLKFIIKLIPPPISQSEATQDMLFVSQFFGKQGDNKSKEWEILKGLATKGDFPRTLQNKAPMLLKVNLFNVY